MTRASGAAAPEVSPDWTLQRGSFTRQATTSTGGVFTFADVPPAVYT
ncbi:MAG: hypothetical protein QM736_03555 [Vicinamibacterales bacterium]